MNFKDFRINIFFRVIILTMTMFAFAVLIGKKGYGFTNLALGGLIIFQLIKLIKYVEHANYEIINFLNAIQFDDFSNTYQLSYSGKSYTDLNTAFQNVLKRFKAVREEKELLYQQLRFIFQHIGVGVLAIRQTGEVDFMNNAAKQILRIHRFSHISQLKALNESLLEKIEQLRAGEKSLVKFRIEGEMVSILVYSSLITVNQKDYKLITIQNIRTELEEQELDSWDKLIRVLIHEIMNSITPISSLAEIADSEATYLQQNTDGLTEDEFEDLRAALSTIKNRSIHLGNFVQDFRRLTNLQSPHFQHLSLKNIFEEVIENFKEKIKNQQIEVHLSVSPTNLMLTADYHQLKNLFSYLLENAIEAEKSPESPKIIHLIAQQDPKSRPLIIVRDNGTGIDEDALERVFIPFFSTKKNASGIGLSLARLIMRQHSGTIVAKSRGGAGTDIVLHF